MQAYIVLQRNICSVNGFKICRLTTTMRFSKSRLEIPRWETPSPSSVDLIPYVFAFKKKRHSHLNTAGNIQTNAIVMPTKRIIDLNSWKLKIQAKCKKLRKFSGFNSCMEIKWNSMVTWVKMILSMHKVFKFLAAAAAADVCVPC